MPLHWPGHNYLGPGTKDFSKKPVDADDEIARQHDLEYASATSNQDIYNSDKKASTAFFNNFTKTWAPESLIASGVLKAKNLLEENIVGRPIYGGMNGKRKADSDSEDLPPNKMANSSDLFPSDSPVSEEPMQADMAAPTGSSGNNSSSSGGSSGASMGDVFAGSSQNPNKSVLTFKKSYHFTLTNALPEWRTFAEEGHVELQARYGSIHGIPWECLSMYCSEGEMLRLRQNYSMCKVLQADCKVYSLGVRLPFVTGQTISSVANANAQYPIACFNFDNDFITSYDTDNVFNIIDKCLGSEWKDTTIGVTSQWSNVFPNLTASTTSRDYNNPVIVHYPRQSLPTANSLENWPKDVGIYDYCSIKNGSTAYGLCWHMSHKPKQGILFSFNDQVANGSRWARGGDGPENTPFTHEQALFIHQSELICSKAENNYTMSDWSLQRAYNDTENAVFYDQLIDNTGIYGVGDYYTSAKAMPKFLIGFVNIRNEDDSLLQAKWDIVIETEIKIAVVDNGQRGFINRIRNPVPYVNDPFLQFSAPNFGNLKLYPRPTMKNVTYNKHVMFRRINLRIFSKDVVDKLKELDKTENKTFIAQIKKDLEDYIKELKESGSKLAKHQSTQFPNEIKRAETVLGFF